MRTLFLAFLVGLYCPSLACAACPLTTTTPMTMAIQSPCTQEVVTHIQNNWKTPGLINVGITDANMQVSPSANYPVQVQAPGMTYLWVLTHGGASNQVIKQLVNDGLGTFSGTIDLSKEMEGPLVLGIYAGNSSPTDIELAANMMLYVHPSGWYNYATIPPQAAGMHVAWADRFGTLSATPCKPNTGTWPHCTAPTASDGFTYYENKPNGGDYGAAAFEHTDGSYNPFTIYNANLGGGYLRIRSTYDPNYVDPYGFKRLWRTGFLATAFPDGSTNLPIMGNGYYEARVIVPYDSAGANGGGTWPSFFMQTINAMKTHCASGDIEEDVFEEYGNDPTYTQMGQHPYCGATGADSLVYAGHPEALVWDWHRHGLLITNTTISYYLDDKLMASAPRDQLVGGVAPQWFLMTTLAMGGGWPVNPPPAGYYDMWVDYVRYLK